jgi:hypothetical protein
LDRRLRRDPDFPVVKRGTRAGGWIFNFIAVQEYLKAADLNRRARFVDHIRSGQPRQAQPVGTVGKKDLAAALTWSRMRLDRRLEHDANFPVVAQGTRAGGWAFDVFAVKTYLGDQ